MNQFESTKYIPYLALTGELWDVFCQDLGENSPRFNGIEVYKECMRTKAEVMSFTTTVKLNDYQSHPASPHNLLGITYSPVVLNTSSCIKAVIIRRIGNYIHDKVWDYITYPFPNI